MLTLIGETHFLAYPYYQNFGGAKHQINMMRYFTLCAGFFASALALAQQPELYWLKRMGANSINERPAKIATDSLGNVFLTGTFNSVSASAYYYPDYSNSSLGYSSGSNALNSALGTDDGYIAKHQATNGSLQFFEPYHFNQTETGIAVCAGNGAVIYTGLQNNNSQAHISKHHAVSGNNIWRNILSDVNSGTGNITPIQVIEDRNGTIFSTGSFAGTLRYQQSPVVDLNSVGNRDIYFVSYKAQGTPNWAKRIGGVGADDIKAMAYDGGQYIYLGGEFQGTVDFDAGAGTFNLTGASGSTRDLFVAKYDTAGNFITAVQFASGDNRMSDIVATTAYVYVVGNYIGNNIDLAPGSATANFNSINGSVDAFYLRLSNTLAFVNAFDIDGLGTETINDITVDANGNAYVCGNFNSATATGGLLNINNSDVSGLTYDGFFANISNGTTINWAYKIGATGNDAAIAIDVDRNGYVTLAGTFNGTVNFNVLSGTAVQATAQQTNYDDAYLVRYNTACPRAVQFPVYELTCANSNLTFKSVASGPLNNYQYQWYRNNLALTDNAKYSGSQNDTLIINNYNAADSGSFYLRAYSIGCAGGVNSIIANPASNVGAVNLSQSLLIDVPVNNASLLNTAGTIGLSGASLVNASSNRANQPTGAVVTGGSINLSSPLTQAQASFSFWIKPTTVTSSPVHFIYSPGFMNSHLSINSALELGWYQSTPVAFNAIGTTLVAGNWYHIALVKDNNNSRFYVNGQLVYQTSGTFSNATNNTSTLFTMSNNDVIAWDDLKVYGRLLSENEILNLYRRPFTISASISPIACPGGNVSFRISQSASNLNYQWYKNGVALNNAGRLNYTNTDSLGITNVALADSGYYYLATTAASLSCVSNNTDSFFLSTAPTNINNGLLQYYPFNNSTTDLINSTSLTATGGNGSFQSINRRNVSYARSLQITSSTRYNLSGLSRDTLSVSLWYFTSLGSANRTLLSSSSQARHLRIDNNWRLGFTDASGNFIASNTALNTNTWNHIVVVKQGTRELIYLNGTLILNSTASFLNTGNNALTILGNTPNANEALAGNIDDLKFFGRALSITDVHVLMNMYEISLYPTPVSTCAGSNNVVFTTRIETNDSTSYQLSWLKNNAPIAPQLRFTGVNNDTFYLSGITPADAGTYEAEVRLADNNCITWKTPIGALLTLNTASRIDNGLEVHYKWNGNLTQFGNRSITPVTNAINYSTDRFTAANGALSCGGTTYLRAATSTVFPGSVNNYSISIWFKTATGGGIVGNANNYPAIGAATAYSPILYVGSDGKLRGGVYTNGYNVAASANSVTDNNWHHAVFVVSGSTSTQSLYLDGILVGTISGTPVTLSSDLLTGVVAASGWPGSPVQNWYYFNGNLDELRIYNRSLTASEVSLLNNNIGFTIAGERNSATCANGTLAIQAMATANVSGYQWKRNGVTLTNGAKFTGSDSNTLIIQNFQSADAGAYTIDISANCFTYSSDTIRVGVITSPVVSLAYPLNGNSNSSINNSQNGNGQQLTPVPNRFGISAKATGFTRTGNQNTSSYAYLPANIFSANSQPYSVSIWFKTSSTNTTMGLLGLANANPFNSTTATAYNPLLYIDQTGKLRGKIHDGILPITTPVTGNAVNDGQWHHAVLTGDLATQKLYLDGVLISTINNNNNTYSHTNSNQLIIGASYAANEWPGHSSGWQFFNGQLDEFRTYATSLNAAQVLALYEETEIVSQPISNRSICVGDTATLNVVAGGYNLSYQWRKNGIPLNNTLGVSGVQTPTLQFNSFTVNDTGKYTCDVIKNCTILGSDTTTISIAPATAITAQPSAVNSCVGSNVTLQVTTNNNNVTYQWQRNGINLTNGGNISGAQQATLVINNLSSADTARYRCYVSSRCGTDTSLYAQVRLTGSLLITRQPQSANVCQGNQAILSIATSTTSLNYEWKKNGVSIPNSNNDTLLINNVNINDGGTYNVVISNNCGIDSSITVNLTVNPKTSITVQPFSQKSCNNTLVSFNVQVSGQNLSYQWQLNKQPLANAQGNSLSINAPSPTDSGLYRVIINGTCGSDTSLEVRLTLATTITINQQPQDSIMVCNDQQQVQVSVVASGSINKYQWFKDNNPIANATNPSYTFTFNNNQVGRYSCGIYGTCDTAFTTYTYVGKYAPSIVQVQPAPVTTCEGSNISFNALLNGVQLSNKQWYKNGIAINPNNPGIIGVQSDTLRINNISSADTGYYQLRATDQCNQPLITDSVYLRLSGALAISSQSSSLLSVCQYQPTYLFVRANQTAQFRWKKNGIAIPQLNNDTLYFNSTELSDSGNYICEVSSACGVVNSDTIRLTINTLPSPVISQNKNTLQTQAFNSYQWYKNGAPISGATAQTYDANENGTYQVEVSNNNGCIGLSPAYNFTYTGLTEPEQVPTSSIFPNPASHTLNITCISGISGINITNALGQKVMSTNQTAINIQLLQPGIYTITIIDINGQQFVHKLIKQ